MSDELTAAMNDVVQPDGRAMNAVRHGLYERRLTVGAEDAAGFEALRTALIDQWRPRDVTAWMLVDHLARLQWRLMRAGESEVRLVEIAQDHFRPWDGGFRERNVPLSAECAVANEMATEKSGLTRMQLFQTRLERSMFRTISMLLTLRKVRPKRKGTRATVLRADRSPACGWSGTGRSARGAD